MGLFALSKREFAINPYLHDTFLTGLFLLFFVQDKIIQVCICVPATKIEILKAMQTHTVLTELETLMYALFIVLYFCKYTHCTSILVS